MKRARLPGMGWLGVILGLFVACSGKVQSLGETAGIGGKGTKNLAGAAGAESTNIAGADSIASGGSGRGWVTQLVGGQGGNDLGSGGYTMGPATGGADASRGGYYGTGGTALSNTGGADASRGGYYGTGGTAPTGGTPSNYPGYPPTGGPIDATCTCPSADQICNLSKECVSRCTSQGLCAKWESIRAVKSMYLDGAALFYATARQTDVLGNPVEPANGSLYTVATSAATTPALVATGLQEPLKILGRFKASTFVLTVTGTTYAIYEVTDAGVVTKLTDAFSPVANMQGRWLVVMKSLSGGNVPSLIAFNLEAGRTPIDVHDLSMNQQVTGLTVVGDVVVERYGYTTLNDKLCVSFSLTAPASGETSLSALSDTTSELLAADSSRIFFGGGTHAYVRAYDTAGSPQLILYNDPTMNRIGTTLLANGWLYSAAYPSDYNMSQLVRYPTSVGHLPQVVLPTDWGTSLFAVGKSDIYWAYPQTASSSSHYIFHAPLAAQPCDAGLPCADTAQVCTNGTCAAP